TLGERAPECFLETCAERDLRARHRHRRLGPSVRQAGQAFGHALHADVLLDQVVIGLEIGVTERPVDAGAIVRRRLELEVTDAKRLAAPDVRPSAYDPGTDPDKLRIGFVHVWLFDVVDEPARVPLADRLGPRLNWPRVGERRLGHPA